VAELSRHPRIRAIKESSGNLSLISEIFSACQEQGSEITVLSGDDPLYLSGLAQGATGLVSVASNLIPNELLEITRFWKKGSIQESQDLFQKISPFLRALFMESNPVPAKCVAYLQGRMQNVLRLPLVPAEPSTQEEIKKCLAQIASK
jgi:4-hydroxy-tetrahydrodipicolinate synthase